MKDVNEKDMLLRSPLPSQFVGFFVLKVEILLCILDSADLF